MPKFLPRLQRRWRKPKLPTAPVVSFVIPCACGGRVSGARRMEHQVVSCPACAAEVFVLPLSPLPAVSGATQDGSAVIASARFSRHWLFLAALVAGFAILGLAYCVALVFLSAGAANNGVPAAMTPEQAQALQRKAEEHISRGHFALALEQLETLDALQRHMKVGWVDAAWLSQERREIALYADLLQRSLEELLAEAIDLPTEEWQQQFQKRYQDKAIILDMEVTRLADGHFEQGYQIHVGGQVGHFDFTNLPFFQTLPAGKPRRLLFGARLKNIERNAPGVWSIQFAADSFVLLTDVQALAIICPGLNDAATRELLAKQKMPG